VSPRRAPGRPAKVLARVLACAVPACILLSAPLPAQEPSAGDGGNSVAAPSETVRPGTATPETAPDGRMWRIRTWGGVSTLRTGSYEVLPNGYWDVRQANWKESLGMDLTSREHEGANVAFVSGLELGYQVDPLVCVAVRVGQFISATGTSRATIEGSGMHYEDTWEYSTDMATLAGGVMLELPLVRRLTLNIDLFLGTGLATLHIQHRQVATWPTGIPTVEAAAADAGGTAFLPEFGAELEYEVTPSLCAGLGMAYRFGGVDEYRHKHESSLNTFATSVEGKTDFPLRDVNRNVVAGDYGGAVLTLLLTARL